MRIKLILLILAILTAATIAFFLLRPKPEVSSLPVGTVLFMDDYEDDPIIRVMSHDEWMKMTRDAKKGNYWGENERWLEMGWINKKGQYRLETRPSIAKVISAVAHSGTKSGYITIPPPPEGYVMTGRWMARYIRNPNHLKHGTYKIEAWFYIPSSETTTETTIASLGFEDHLNWMDNHFFQLMLDPQENVVGYYYKDWEIARYEVLSEVDFQYNTWFKLWMVAETGQKQGWTAGYESPMENKTFEIDKVLTTPHIGYIGTPALNIYAGGLKTDDREGQIYVDDFYAKVVG